MTEHTPETRTAQPAEDKEPAAPAPSRRWARRLAGGVALAASLGVGINTYHRSEALDLEQRQARLVMVQAYDRCLDQETSRVDCAKTHLRLGADDATDREEVEQCAATGKSQLACMINKVPATPDQYREALYEASLYEQGIADRLFMGTVGTTTMVGVVVLFAHIPPVARVLDYKLRG